MDFNYSQISTKSVENNAKAFKHYIKFDKIRVCQKTATPSFHFTSLHYSFLFVLWLKLFTF